MDTIQLLTNQWIEWQIRAFFFSAMVLFAAAPMHWRSPIWRHWILVSGALALIAFPLFIWILPSFELLVIPSQLTIDPFRVPVHMNIELNGGNLWKQLVVALSLITCIVILFRYMKAWRRQFKKLAAGKAPNIELQQQYLSCVDEVGLAAKEIDLVIGASNEAPCTLGWLQPKIFLPESADSWEPEDLRIVLLHELLHIKRRDWLWQQSLFLLLLLYPLNPLVWRIKRTARGLAEESVDKLSLSLGIAPMTYASALLKQLRKCRQIRSSVAVHMQQRVDIVERVGSLISEPYTWPQITRFHSIQISLVFLVFTVPFAVLHFDQRPVEHWSRELALPMSWSAESPQVEDNALPRANDPRTIVAAIDVPDASPALMNRGLATVAPERFDAEVPMLLPSGLGPRVEISREPRPVYLARPEYPASGIRRGQEATVEVVFDLNDAGEVINPRVLTPGNWSARKFEKAALEAIGASRYNIDDSKGLSYFKKDLTQTYVFELVDDSRQSSSENVALNPP